MYRSHSLGIGSLSGAAGTEDKASFAPAKLPDGRAGRLVTITFRPPVESERGHADSESEAARPLLKLTLAHETRLLDRTLARLLGMLVGVGAGTMLACAAVMSYVVRRGTRPLETLARQISAMGEDLAARINLPNAPMELEPVSQRLNDLLQRLQRAFEREKSLSADVAHELRTPLAGLRSTLEVCLARPREIGEYRDALHDCLTVTLQMQAMVGKLLSLVRIELGQCAIDQQEIDLQTLLADCWREVQDQATSRSLRVEWKVDTSLRLVTDQLHLRQVIHNLLDNAVSYADPNGQVTIETMANGTECRLRVSNSAAGITPAEVEHAFERFWRGEKARSGTGHHCGLGLALAKRLVTLLGGTIQAEADGGLFQVTLTFPTLQPTGAEAATPVNPVGRTYGW